MHFPAEKWIIRPESHCFAAGGNFGMLDEYLRDWGRISRVSEQSPLPRQQEEGWSKEEARFRDSATRIADSPFLISSSSFSSLFFSIYI